MLPPKKTIPVCRILVPYFRVKKSLGIVMMYERKIPKIRAKAAWFNQSVAVKKITVSK
jgi:hypothetical protein